MSTTDNSIEPNSYPKTWCEEDNHHLFQCYSDFNEWLDGDSEESQSMREKYSIDNLPQPSKAFFAGDQQAYQQAFKIFREERKDEVLAKQYIQEKFNDLHWHERNEGRFDQLLKCLLTESVVPFIGAGISVDGGFPTWRKHLQQQGRTSGINADHIKNLLDNGKYEEVILEIENKGYRDAFIQEIKDVFSKTGKITDTTLRVSELFTDTIITTNYDHIIEQAFETGVENPVQVIDSNNVLEQPNQTKTTVIKLHGDINQPTQCILGKTQYDEAYGNGSLDLNKPIPKLISYYYQNSSLLFLGCSLYQDRTMQVFQAVKDKLGDTDRPPHFSLESMPETEEEISYRNNYLLSFGITPIWFPKDSYDYIERILRLARNEMRYNGYQPKQKTTQPKIDQPPKKTPGLFAKIGHAALSVLLK